MALRQSQRYTKDDSEASDIDLGSDSEELVDPDSDLDPEYDPADPEGLEEGEIYDYEDFEDEEPKLKPVKKEVFYYENKPAPTSFVKRTKTTLAPSVPAKKAAKPSPVTLPPKKKANPEPKPSLKASTASFLSRPKNKI